MRAALVTLFPMLAAAVLVMVGGERMARREVEIRTLFDRSRLLDLDEAFRAELTRLDGVYLGHLADLTTAALSDKPDAVAAEALKIPGVSLIRVFRKNGKNLRILPDWKLSNLPEIELSNGKVPLNSEKAVMLEASMLNEPLPPKGKWIGTSDSRYLVHCDQAAPDTLVVFLIERARVSERIASHLGSWLKTPLTPLREAGGSLLIDPPHGDPLIALGSEQHGPAASIIPIRTNFGDWQIRTWDGLVVKRSHDPGVLALATMLAALFIGCGVVLMLQQKRALKLAAERVSFVNRVSHEFGAPLTNLSLNLDLATDFLTSRPEEARRRLGLVAEEIERLSRLVANVLTFSRRERDTLELKPVSCMPEEVIQRVIESFRPSLERRGIGIEAEFSASEAVRIDPDALSQITGNLLSNVEKYAAAERWLGLDCRVVAGFLILEVRDRGAGISAAARQRVFIPFERVLQATNEGASGTGLGLSIARDLARRMGGDLELLDSEVGACFQLRVPAPPVMPQIFQS
jgi:signal transduction histidine kinase